MRLIRQRDGFSQASASCLRWPLDLILKFFVSILCLCFPFLVQAQPKGINLSQQALSAYLRHEAELAQSAECQYEFICSVTPPDMIPSIREACRNNGNEPDYVSFIYTEDIA